jgi:arylsulfatase A-like enzyme
MFKILPQSLKEAGYATCMAGKWHLSDDPLQYGFDQNFGGFHKGHPPSYFSPYNNPHLTDGPQGEYLPERLATEINHWLDENHTDPFFLFYPFYLVHTPNQPKPELKEKYDQLPKGKYHMKPSYAAMVEAMDQSVGKVIRRLETLGVLQNTIIIFTSDNGPMGANSVAKPLRGTKGMLYEGGIRVPFFIKWPGYQGENNVVSTPIIGSDIYPTVLEMIGQKSENQNFDGLSFLDVLNGKDMMERPLFWHFPAYLEMSKRDRAYEETHTKPFRATPCSVVRLGDWKLIRYYEDGDIELFNLHDDIGENTNLAQLNIEKRDELLKILNHWLSEVNAPIPQTKNPAFTHENEEK